MYLSKSPILESEPLCLRATGAQIKEIDMLSTTQTDALSLYVSHNQIKKIDNIYQFRSLERFLIEYNQITYIEDLYPLAQLPKLKELRMEGNPVCRLTLFEIYVMFLCPGLEILNGKKTSSLFNKKYTHEQLKDIIQSENSFLRMTLMAEIIISELKKNPSHKIVSVENEANKRYPPNVVLDKYLDIRQKANGLNVAQYFDYLAGILFDKHQIISKLANNDAIKKPDLEYHDEKLAKATNYSSSLNDKIKAFTELHDSACFLIEDEKKGNDDQYSKVKSILSRGRTIKLQNCARSVCPVYSIKKSGNRDAQSTITGQTDAQSILGYFLGPDQELDNNDAKSTKSARSMRSAMRRQKIIQQMKENNRSPKPDKTSQADIGDVALNIQDGKIILVDPNSPDNLNYIPEMSPPGSLQSPKAETRNEIEQQNSPTVSGGSTPQKKKRRIVRKKKSPANQQQETSPQTQNNKLNNQNNTAPTNNFDDSEQDSDKLANNKHDNIEKDNNETVNEKDNNQILMKNNNDNNKRSANQKKVKLLIDSPQQKVEDTKHVIQGNKQDISNKEIPEEPQVKELENDHEQSVIHHCKVVETSVSGKYSVSSCFVKWKWSYLSKHKKNIFHSQKVSSLYEKVDELNEEISFLEKNQSKLSPEKQARLIAEATKRRELLRKIDHYRELISKSNGRSTQFISEINATENFRSSRNSLNSYSTYENFDF
ncbi:hypothetical protein TRFO_35729 [Tritrichomonas foetus]|uniref:Leucine Rich Repeat family protein n=1 Tax=Tritrichomonas foetus TaxID=1144522 RepID=A0A1J4JI42_9EUKA|nr:hypothetical protein TRFO_35729 [Tritrichomonas foetus]|eukprot:OHS97935.1 hypothetical protein TRFO_35729 [Tritrichomonas foetus]